ncbi:MAG: hypothetical protein O7A98_09810 [Acidobacteria bacterium]|nr:hypothetical protein [Acidobacteriota bacterium]
MRYLYLWVSLLVTAVVAAWAGESVVIEFPRLNDTFRDMAPEIMPVASGGLTILLSSPRNSLTIRRHEVELESLGGNLYRFRGMVDFMGKADLIAEFSGAMPGRVEDQVLLPIQRLELEGEVQIVRVPDGYDITTRVLPGHVEIAMQSRLGNQLVSLCDVLSIFTGGDCSALVAAFGRVRLPLPPPGETHRLAAETLTAEERQTLDDYLSSTGVACAVAPRIPAHGGRNTTLQTSATGC